MFNQCVEHRWGDWRTICSHWTKHVFGIYQYSTSAFLFFLCCGEVVNWKAFVHLLWVWHTLINSETTFEVAANRCTDVTLVRWLQMRPGSRTSLNPGFCPHSTNRVLAVSHDGPELYPSIHYLVFLIEVMWGWNICGNPTQTQGEHKNHRAGIEPITFFLQGWLY